jgi:FAD/FMN-containing dehydrogenase
MHTDDLLAQLAEIVGAGYLLTSKGDLEPFITDWRGRYHGNPRCVIRPGSTYEVAAVVRCCAAANAAIVPQGGNTGLCGGATPIGGEVLISLKRLDHIRSMDAQNNCITVEAGCLLQHVQQVAENANRLFPLSLASEGSATIGGNLSTNAGGVQVLRYGNTRDLTLGLEVVLPNGEIWHGLRALRKDNTGYDLKQLFIGAEGTLGIITAATLKLFPRPRHVATAWVDVSSPKGAVELLEFLRESLGEFVSAFELIGRSALDLVLKHIPQSQPPLTTVAEWQVLIELAGMHPLLDELTRALERADELNLLSGAVIASSERQAAALWSLRENISEAQKREGLSIKHDISIPLSSIPSFVTQAEASLKEVFPHASVVCFGHVGDGNLHFNISSGQGAIGTGFMECSTQVNRIVHDLVAKLHGSISAEHGLGQLKREEIRRYKSPVELALMQQIKRCIDPLGLMNPGKVVM